jgi:hypothetical protein
MAIYTYVFLRSWIYTTSPTIMLLQYPTFPIPSPRGTIHSKICHNRLLSRLAYLGIYHLSHNCIYFWCFPHVDLSCTFTGVPTVINASKSTARLGRYQVSRRDGEVKTFDSVKATVPCGTLKRSARYLSWLYGSSLAYIMNHSTIVLLEKTPVIVTV